jgi:hypothetical protein
VADNVMARQDGSWNVVSTLPDVCKTPMGGSTPPVPYPVTASLGSSLDNSLDVRANKNPVVRFDSSYSPSTMGDAAGVGTGVRSGTVGGQCWPSEKSSSLRANGKPVIRHGDEFQMNGSYSGKTAKGQRWNYRKAMIADARRRAAALPNGPEKFMLQSAANRFERNNYAVEHAKLAADVYDHSPAASHTPDGWVNASEDPQALAKFGLKSDDLSIPNTNFRAQVYSPDPKVFGSDLKPTIVFQGTNPTSFDDWSNNVRQGSGADSPYYKRAVDIGTKLLKKGADIDIAGHSLGGGMASAASVASGLPATTYNAAGLNPETVTKYGGTVMAPSIDVYQVDEEVLTGLQENSVLSGKMPKAIGTRYPLPGSGGSVERHGMDEVIAGIEIQKRQDEATLRTVAPNA